MAPLAQHASARLITGFRPATLNNYLRMFKLFLAFLITYDIATDQVNTITILSYMEFLCNSHMSASNISNHLAGIRTMYIVHGLSTTPFKDERLALYLKALRLNAQPVPRNRSVVTLQMLEQILQACLSFEMQFIYKPLYLLAFYSVLRLSNILPHSLHSFDPTRQLCRGDIIFSSEHAVVLIKWSKTRQDRSQVFSISIPVLGNSPLCPVSALKTMIDLVPATCNDPLFLVPTSRGNVPLTDSMARKHLKKLTMFLKVSGLTFHAFRRGGTTWAFEHGVNTQFIKQHGTWKSDCYQRYIKSISTTPSPVSSTFRHHLLL